MGGRVTFRLNNGEIKISAAMAKMTEQMGLEIKIEGSPWDMVRD
jgi:hypothetical protein